MWIKEISSMLDTVKSTPASPRENDVVCPESFEKHFINYNKKSILHLSKNFSSNSHSKMVNSGCEKDTFQCGRCKSQFQLLTEFMDHKRFHCTLTQSQMTEEATVKTDPPQDNNSIPIGNLILNTLDNRIIDTYPLKGESKNNKVVNVVSNESLPENRIVSIVMGDNGMVYGNPLDLSGFSGQVVFVPQTPLCYNGMVVNNSTLLPGQVINNSSDISSLAGQVIDDSVDVSALPDDASNAINISPLSGQVNNNSLDASPLSDQVISNSVDISALPGQVIVTPTFEEMSMLVNNLKKKEPVEGLVLSESTDSREIIYTYQNESDSVVLTAEVPNEELVAIEGLNQPENNFPDSTLNEKSISINSSHLQFQSSNLLEFGNIKTGKKKLIDASEQIDEGELEKKAKLPCSYCGKIFDKPFNLQQHERVHTGERPFQCIICGRAFSQKSNVRKHMTRHKVWPKPKQTLKITQDHNEENLLTQMNYFCQYCSLSFKSYSLHKKHLAVHSNYKVYRCIQKGCDETFSDLDEFLSHSKMHSPAEFQCHICLKSFTSLDELGAHQYDHDTTSKEKKETEVKLKCKICHAQFKAVESLKNHLAVDTHNYECVHCKSVFNSERFLRRHLNIHLDPSHSKFKCQSCKKTFRTEKSLKNHAFIHLQEKPFNCDHCGKQFASKYRLTRHLAVHLSQHLECPFKSHLGCDKTFYRKDKLRDHISTHSHCRLRSCQVCSKTYRSVAKLNQHMKTEHKNGKDKPVLRCKICSQTFRKQKQLIQHHCTVGEKKFRSNRIKTSSEDKVQKSETVSNIEIIMVPFVSKRLRNGEEMT